MTKNVKVRTKRNKKPIHEVTIRAFKFPIITNDKESSKFFDTSKICCFLRNHLVQQRTDNRNKIKEYSLTKDNPNSLL